MLKINLNLCDKEQLIEIIKLQDIEFNKHINETFEFQQELEDKIEKLLKGGN